MRLSIYLLLFVSANLNAKDLPREVDNFVFERSLCDHFRGEDFEGDHDRAKFVRDSLDIYCAGTTDRLSALKRRYREEKYIIDLLNQYEEDIGN